MPWLYNRNTGLVQHQNEVEWLADETTGSWSGLVNLGIPDSDTMSQAVAAAQRYATEHHTTAPTTSSDTANANAVSNTALGQAAQPLEDIGQAFHAIGEKSTWIRVGKVVIGGALIIAGVIHLSGADKAARDIARKIPVIP